MEQAEADLLSSFLMPMLNYYPDSRATAGEMARHPWLDGIVVQGEMELEFAKEERRRSGGAEEIGQGIQQQSVHTRPIGAEAAQGGPSASPAKKEKEKKSSKGKGALEEVLKLGPAVKGMVGMGRV